MFSVIKANLLDFIFHWICYEIPNSMLELWYIKAFTENRLFNEQVTNQMKYQKATYLVYSFHKHY